MNKLLNKIKERKKIIILIFTIVFCFILLLIIINFLNKNNTVSIEIVSDNVSYSYGPNGTTIVNVNRGETVNLAFVVDPTKSMLVKCFSNNENLIYFQNKDSFVAINSGKTEVYCKLLNEKSNIVNVNILNN